MNEAQGTNFSKLVERKLSSEETRTLWIPLAHEFDRTGGGPDSARQWLDTELQRLQEKVRRLLDHVEGRSS